MYDENNFDPIYILSSWEKLHDNLSQLSEAQLSVLLKAEKSNGNRPNYIKRIHARFSKLRAQREYDELTNGGNNERRK